LNSEMQACEVMELIYVIPADAAEAGPNGKFSLLGGGIESIFAHAFPAIHPGLALVVRLRVQPSEAKQDHEFRVDIVGPNAINVTPGAMVLFKPEALLGDSERAVSFNLIMNISPLMFPEPGEYLGYLYIDGQKLGTFPLNVQQPKNDEMSSS
jgi:hypothetical protein